MPFVQLILSFSNLFPAMVLGPFSFRTFNRSNRGHFEHLQVEQRTFRTDVTKSFLWKAIQCFRRPSFIWWLNCDQRMIHQILISISFVWLLRAKNCHHLPNTEDAPLKLFYFLIRKINLINSLKWRSLNIAIIMRVPK